MTVPTKRRPLVRYLLLPLIVALVFVSVAKLTALQRAEMVGELADQVAHQDAATASVALRQLAAMPRPPMDVLAATAASSDAELADQAQVLINGMLRRWQRKLDAGDSVAGIGRQLSALSSALAQHRQSFSAGDHRWLVATSQKILRMANKIPARHTPLVAQHCDAVLATVAANEARIAQLIDRDLAALPLWSAGPTGTVHDVANRYAPSTRPSDGVESNPNTAAPAAPSMSTPESHLIDPMMGSEPGETNDHFQDARRGATSPGVQPGSRLTWTQPLLNVAPDTPLRQPQIDSNTLRSTASFRDNNTAPVDLQSIPRSWERTDSRELLHRWLLAGDNEMAAMEAELIRRGFGHISDPLVEQFVSADASQRLQLVDNLMKTPGIDARPWLALLADDSDADVRLLTITIMATSNDRELLDKAWEIALRDRDPRIAGLASRLRERRDAAHRR